MKALRCSVIFWIIFHVFDSYAIYHKIGDYNTGGRVVSVDYKDNIVFTGKYYGLVELINVDHPDQPFLISSIQVPEIIPGVRGKVVVYDTVLYVLGEYNIYFIDISDVYSPYCFGLLNIDEPRDIIIKDNLAYIAGHFDLCIFDFSDLQNPQQLNTFYGQLDGICLKDSLIYGVHSSSNPNLRIINVADPFNPTVLGTINLPIYSSADIEISDQTVLIGNTYTLWSIDVSNPFSPVVLDTLSLYNATTKLFIKDNTAFITQSNSGISLIDFSDPENLNIFGFYDTPGLSEQVIVNDNIAYIAEGYSGVQIVDLSDNLNPFLIGEYSDPGFRSRDLAITGDYLFVADQRSMLDLINIQDVFNPVFDSSFFSEYSPGDNVSIFNNRLCFSHEYDWPDLFFIDITEPEAPVLVNQVDLSDYILYGSVALFQTQNNVLVGAGQTLLIYDVTDFNNPAMISSYTASAQIMDVIIQGNTGYMAVAENGIETINLENLYAPSLLGSYDTQGEAIQLNLDSNILIVADGPGGFALLDASDPAIPQLIEVFMPNYNSNIQVKPLIFQDKMIIVDKEWNELFTYNVEDFSDISLISSFRINTEIHEFIYNSGYFFCSMGNYGIQIIDDYPIISGVTEQIDNPGISIFPNPASSFITININKGIPIEETIIYNHLGQKVLETKPVNNTVDVSMLKPGIYFLEVGTKDWSEMTKFVKQ
jgi:hypothetical protein